MREGEGINRDTNIICKLLLFDFTGADRDSMLLSMLAIVALVRKKER